MNLYEELGETARRQILAELRCGPKTVTGLVEATGLKQPNVSNHLSRMRAKGIVKFNKAGREVHYCLASPEVEAVVKAVLAIRCGESPKINLQGLVATYAKAAIEGDEDGCADIVDSAFRAQATVIDIYNDLLAPAMGLIGCMFAQNEIDICQERLASEVTERMLARTARISGPTRKVGKSCVLGCAPNTRHTLGLRMACDILRFAGWNTLYLGADLPSESFVSAVQRYCPEMVLISCCASQSVEETLDLIRTVSGLRTQGLDFVIGIGGPAVGPRLAEFLQAGGDFAAKDLRHFANCLLPKIEAGCKSLGPLEALAS